jgi:hypothetical protein
VGQNIGSQASDLVVNAMGYLGVPYRRGGTGIQGFDCSGFVQAMFENTLGLVLPHNAKAQAAATEKIDKNELRGINEQISREAMPPLEFRYSRFEPERKKFKEITGKDLSFGSLSEGQYELVDLMGFGLPDVVQLGGNVELKVLEAIAADPSLHPDEVRAKIEAEHADEKARVLAAVGMTSRG